MISGPCIPAQRPLQPLPPPPALRPRHATLYCLLQMSHAHNGQVYDFFSKTFLYPHHISICSTFGFQLKRPSDGKTFLIPQAGKAKPSFGVLQPCTFRGPTTLCSLSVCFSLTTSKLCKGKDLTDSIVCSCISSSSNGSWHRVDAQ